MNGEIKYRADTPAKDLVKAIRKLGACSEAMKHLSGLFPEEQLPNASVKDVLQTVPNQGWALWLLEVFGERADTEMHQVLISKIVDPMMAFRLYLDLSYLTDEEDKLLEEKFKGKLPTAEKELKDGMVKRAELEVQ